MHAVPRVVYAGAVRARDSSEANAPLFVQTVFYKCVNIDSLIKRIKRTTKRRWQALTSDMKVVDAKSGSCKRGPVESRDGWNKSIDMGDKSIDFQHYRLLWRDKERPEM